MSLALRRLREGQKAGLLWSDNIQHPGFIVDKRMGKTLLSIRRIKRWKDSTVDCKHSLIITMNTAIDDWIRDLQMENVSFHYLVGSRASKLTTLNNEFENSSPQFFLSNKESSRVIPEIADKTWFCVVIDESIILANPQSGVSKFFTKHFRFVPHRIILTGAPDFKNLLDYYQQLRFLNPSILPWSTYWNYRNQGFLCYGHTWSPTKKTKEVMSKLIAQNCFLLKRAAEGRQKIFRQEYITMPRIAQDLYNSLEKSFVLKYKGVIKVKTIYATVAAINLLRITGGFFDSGTDSVIQNSKIKKLTELLSETEYGEQTVVICRFINEVERLTEILIEKGISVKHIYGKVKMKNRALIKHEFSQKKFKVLIAQANTISHGTDLSAARRIIFYSQPNGKNVRNQVEDRIITLHDKQNVEIVDILIQNTVDEDQYFACISNQTARAKFERMISRWKL